MKSKTTLIFYWITTIIFVLFMVMDGIGGLLRVEEGKEGLAHLGYPEYLMSIVGIAKLLGALAIIQTRYNVIKEWAYAGFTINFVGASMSHFFVGDDTFMMIAPLIALCFQFITYWLWKIQIRY